MRTLGLCLLGSVLVAQDTAAGTARLGPPLQLDETQTGPSVLDSLNTVPDAMGVLTHEGTGKTLEELQAIYSKKASLSNTAAKGASGASGAGKRAQALEWKGQQAKKATFLDKVGKTLNVLDLWGKAWQGIGRAWEGDYVGVGELVVDEATKKLIAAAGATGGGFFGGPLGSVAGAAAGEEFHTQKTGPWITKLADAIRAEQAKDAGLGFGWSGRYTGRVTWQPTFVQNAPNGEPTQATLRFTGTMEATLDAKTGNLQLNVQLQGGSTAPRNAGDTARLGPSLNIHVSATLSGRAENGRFTAQGQGESWGTLGGDDGMTGRNRNAWQASGTYTQEVLTGTLRLQEAPVSPLTFTLTKVR